MKQRIKADQVVANTYCNKTPGSAGCRYCALGWYGVIAGLHHEVAVSEFEERIGLFPSRLSDIQRQLEHNRPNVAMQAGSQGGRMWVDVQRELGSRPLTDAEARVLQLAEAYCKANGCDDVVSHHDDAIPESSRDESPYGNEAAIEAARAGAINAGIAYFEKHRHSLTQPGVAKQPA